MRKAWIVYCLVVLALTMGCDGTTQSHSGSGKFVIEEIVPKSPSRNTCIEMSVVEYKRECSAE